MNTLDLYITKVCNLNCEYCYVDLTNIADSFQVSKFTRKYLLNYDEIKFFGGEPLLAWKNIQKIVNILRLRKPEMQFTIVTNGLLLNAQKIDYIKIHNIEVVISVHKKGFASLKQLFGLLYPIKSLVGFSFIFEIEHISFPRKVVQVLAHGGFSNFLMAPEIYTDWNEKNLSILKRELEGLLKLSKQYKHVKWKGVDGESLKIIVKGCEKVIMNTTGEYVPCNKFQKLENLKDIGYKGIHNIYNKLGKLEDDPDKWFYICPIGWYLDSIDNYEIEYRIKQYKKVNQLFIWFFREIQSMKSTINFLTKNINEIRFNVTSQCNLRCNYCYLDFKDTKIDIKQAKNIVDFHLLQDGKDKVISFFGGEPLLEFQSIKVLSEYALRGAKRLNKNLLLKIATNFTLMNDTIISFLLNNHFEIHISLNGYNDINNNLRDRSSALLEKKITHYKAQLEKLNTVILLAFAPGESLNNLFKSVLYIKKLGFNTINLEIILGKQYNWTLSDYYTLEKQLSSIFKIPNMKLYNMGNKGVILDVSVEGKADSNSFAFHNYEVDFQPKKIFNKLLDNVYKN